MKINLQQPSLIVLCAPAGTGKSTFASKHFRDDEVVSSDRCRYLVSGDESDQSATKEAFKVLHTLIEARLSLGYLTVVDSTALTHRQFYIDTAQHFNVPKYIILFRADRETIIKQDSNRSRSVGVSVIDRHLHDFAQAEKDVLTENWDGIYSVDLTKDDVEIAYRYLNFQIDDPGPFDIIGDVHGCAVELLDLLYELGYTYDPHANIAYSNYGRKAIFVGDIADRGKQNWKCLDLVRKMVRGGYAYCIQGNHDNKLLRYLRGSNVVINNGLEETVSELRNIYSDDKIKLLEFLEELPPYLIFDEGKLVVSHAGIKERMIGVDNKAVRDFCLYGKKTGEDNQGKPIREDWAKNYRGRPFIVYGHTVVEEPKVCNNTLCIDTGCGKGGKLTALRWPEREIVQVGVVQ